MLFGIKKGSVKNEKRLDIEVGVRKLKNEQQEDKRAKKKYFR